MPAVRNASRPPGLRIIVQAVSYLSPVVQNVRATLFRLVNWTFSQCWPVPRNLVGFVELLAAAIAASCRTHSFSLRPRCSVCTAGVYRVCVGVGSRVWVYCYCYMGHARHGCPICTYVGWFQCIAVLIGFNA